MKQSQANSAGPIERQQNSVGFEGGQSGHGNEESKEYQGVVMPVNPSYRLIRAQVSREPRRKSRLLKHPAEM